MTEHKTKWKFQRVESMSHHSLDAVSWKHNLFIPSISYQLLIVANKYQVMEMKQAARTLQKQFSMQYLFSSTIPNDCEKLMSQAPIVLFLI